MNKTILNATMLTTAIALFLTSFPTATANTQWTIQISGTVTNSFSVTLQDLAKMPQTNVQADLLCFGTYITGGKWTGVKLKYLLEQAEIQQGAQSVAFYAQDGYTTKIPIEDAQRDDVIIALKLEDKPLDEILRLVVPGANGEYWINAITSITVSMDPYDPYQRYMRLSPPNQTPPNPPKNSPTNSAIPPQNQTANQPHIPPSDSQPWQQPQSFSSLDIPTPYGYLITLLAIVTATTVIGYMAYDYRKTKQQRKSESR